MTGILVMTKMVTYRNSDDEALNGATVPAVLIGDNGDLCGGTKRFESNIQHRENNASRAVVELRGIVGSPDDFEDANTTVLAVDGVWTSKSRAAARKHGIDEHRPMPRTLGKVRNARR